MSLRPSDILREARNKGELSSLETLILLEADDAILPDLMALADERNEEINGREVGYVRAKKIHYTNICRAKCKICSFYRLKGEAGAFSEPEESIVQQVRRSFGITMVHLSGGLNPDLNLRYHVGLVAALRDRFPDLHIHGYSPTEILFLSRRSRMHYRDVLRQLKDAGLDSLSGDSAAVLNDKLRKKLCADKLRTNDWIDIIRAAHRMDIPSTATVLFGHLENEVCLSEHLDILKRLQRETGYFTVLELVPFIPEGTPLEREGRLKHKLTPEGILRMCAITRLSVGDLFPNIRLDWIRTGLSLAQRAIRAGINDLGPLYYDDFEIRARHVTRTSITVAMVESAISRAKKIPVQRKPFTVKKPPANLFSGQPPFEPVYIRNF